MKYVFLIFISPQLKMGGFVKYIVHVLMGTQVIELLLRNQENQGGTLSKVFRSLKLELQISPLFLYFKICHRQIFITVLRILFFFSFFFFYELNAVVSIHNNVFYPSTSTLKTLYVNFFGASFVTICLFCKFFVH